jgi:flagellar biosynthesis chaperone FliJ
VVKTKFDALVKLKKLDVDKLTREIIKQNGKIAKANQELIALNEEFNKIEYPKSGNFSMITQIKIMQNALLNQINLKKEEIKFLENQKNLLNAQLKDKEIEYEKMKYLQGEEIKKIINKLKKEEAKNMDEIALILFKGQK